MPLDAAGMRDRDAALTPFQRALDPTRIYVRNERALPSRAGPRLRILSWNIGRGHRPERIADTIAAIAPDIACLQEVDWGCERTGGRDTLRILAERTGMLGLFGIEFFELDAPHRPHRHAGGGVTGNALLTRIRPSATFRIDLPEALDWEHGAHDPALPRRVRRQLGREPRLGRRCAIGMTLDVGVKLSVWSAHFEDKFGGVAGRFAQFRALAAVTSPGPSVIAGDFNTFDSPLARLLRPDGAGRALGKPALSTEAAWWRRVLLPAAGYADPFGPGDWTFRAGLFRSKLDWIAVQGGTVRAEGRGAMAPSDHRPIWADVEINDSMSSLRAQRSNPVSSGTLRNTASPRLQVGWAAKRTSRDDGPMFRRAEKDCLPRSIGFDRQQAAAAPIRSGGGALAALDGNHPRVRQRAGVAERAASAPCPS